MTVFRPATVLLACAYSLTLHAYNEPTHEVLSDVAVTQSDLGGSTSPVLRDLGFQVPSARGNGDKLTGSDGIPNTVVGLIQRGSKIEDGLPRPINHFYDPKANVGLLPVLTFPSPDWILEDRFTIEEQQYSFRRARTFLHKALTESSKPERDKNFGLAFETLGRVIHHIQDMAQPQHVRLDQHLKLRDANKSEWFFENRSRYERYTQQVHERRVPGETLPFVSDEYPGDPAVKFGKARDYWTDGQGGGLADFTNSNFVSYGTNFLLRDGQVSVCARYAEPAPNGNTYAVPVEQLFAGDSKLADLQKECVDLGRECVMTFYATTVKDARLGDRENPRASTLSIFSQDLTTFGKSVPCENSDNQFADRTDLIFSLNRFNFKEAHKFLIPRAVAYSAGMINYFFRGKIDLVPDPAIAGQYLVKNLGAEPINGRFALYYDDAQEVRKLVKARNGNDLVWNTVGLLPPDKAGVLAAGGSMVVAADFVPPADAKVPGEYMLVFSGEMGQEKAASDAAGAVVGKLIRSAPYRGALYVAGLDAQNRIITFKVDPEGLRVLNGLDANGQPHYTPETWYSPAQKDIDPLYPVVQSHGGTVLPKLNRMKQVVFEPGGLGGMSHQTIALSLPVKWGGFLSYVAESATGRLLLRGSSFRWIARSNDPAIGEFEFWPEVQSDGINAILYYSRRYWPVQNQNPLTASGVITLPTFPGIAFRSEDINYVSYNGFKSGNVVISPDGLTVSGFKTQVQDASRAFFWDAYDLKLILAAQPSVSVVQTEHVRLNSSTPSLDNVNEYSLIGPGPGPDSHWVEHKKSVSNFDSITFDRKFFVDYINNNLVAWRERISSVSINEFAYDKTDDEVWSSRNACPYTITRDIVLASRSARKTITTTTVALDKPVVSLVKDLPKTYNYTHNYSYHSVHNYYCNGIVAYGTPVVVDNQMFDPEIPDPNPSFSGFTLYRTLNGKVNGSIFLNWAAGYIGRNPPPATTYSIQGRPLGFNVNAFIADASPLGEIFVATTDKSVVVYDPIPTGGMPQVLDIPSNIVKLIAAVWL